MMREHNLDIYAISPWTKWYDRHKKPHTEYTIMEFKSMFNDKRPDWSKTFRERGVNSTRLIKNRYKNHFIIPDECNLKSLSFWSIDREKYIPDLNIKRNVVIERLLDASGNCRRVSIIHLQGRGIPLILREENKISNGVWTSATREISDKWTDSSYSKLLKLPEPWSIYF